MGHRHFMPPPTKFDPLRAQAKAASGAAPRASAPPPVMPPSRPGVPPPPRPAAGPTSAPGMQAKPASQSWRAGTAPRAVQRASDSKTIAEDIWESATDSGHSSTKEGEFVDLVTLKRSSLAFFSDSWMAEHGVEKPAGTDACENCGKTTTQAWELDHLNPWRPYVAALLSEDQYKKIGKKLMVPFEYVRSLYNDPANLWYICHTCNSAKSDKIYSSVDDLAADVAIAKKARPKRARTRGKGVLTVL